MLACVDKNIAIKFIGVALRLLNSQWKIHHCDMLCLVLSSLCSLQAYNYAEHLHNILLFCTTSPPTHFTRAPPSPAKNRYLNSRLMILHASELATELFEEVQSPRCTFATSIATAKAIRGRFVARVKALGWLKKKRNSIFTTSRFVTLTTISSNLGAVVELGQLSSDAQNSPPGEILAFER